MRIGIASIGIGDTLINRPRYQKDYRRTNDEFDKLLEIRSNERGTILCHCCALFCSKTFFL